MANKNNLLIIHNKWLKSSHVYIVCTFILVDTDLEWDNIKMNSKVCRTSKCSIKVQSK